MGGSGLAVVRLNDELLKNPPKIVSKSAQIEHIIGQ